MNILFITNTGRLERPYLDPSVRYRCYNPADDLFAKGHTVDVVTFHSFDFLMSMHYDCFIFHRPPYGSKLEASLAIMDKYNKLYYASYDDLIFSPEHALESSLYKTGRASEYEVMKIFNDNHKAMMMFDNFFVSTEPLREIVLELKDDAKVNIIHNGLSLMWMKRARMAKKTKVGTKKTITYFSGTKSHDHDFEIVEEALLEFLNLYPEYTLVIVGPLDFDKQKFSNKVDTLRYVEYEKLPNLIQKSWINIAPLEDNIFNRCKSGLKFFEAAVMGVPSVVTPIPDFTRFENSEISFANNSNEWIESLTYFNNILSIDNDLDDRLYRYVLKNCLSEQQTNKMEKIMLEDLK